MGYQPKEPYVIRHGKHAGESIERLFLQNPGLVLWMHSKYEQEKANNSLHVHMDWMLSQISLKEPEVLCPVCGQKSVRFFSIIKGRSDFTVGLEYTCCDSEECRQNLISQAPNALPELLPLNYSSLERLTRRAEKRAVGAMLKKVFNVPTPLTKDRAFRFFLTT